MSQARNFQILACNIKVRNARHASFGELAASAARSQGNAQAYALTSHRTLSISAIGVLVYEAVNPPPISS
jgi:hypothetical protein